MADSENVLDWWWGGVQTRDARPSVLSITDGLCSGGHSQRAGTTGLVLGGHDSIHLHICTLLAPQSGALRISAYRDFHPIPSIPLIAFEHLSLSMVIRNSASRLRQINVDQ